MENTNFENPIFDQSAKQMNGTINCTLDQIDTYYNPDDKDYGSYCDEWYH